MVCNFPEYRKVIPEMKKNTIPFLLIFALMLLYSSPVPAQNDFMESWISPRMYQEFRVGCDLGLAYEVEPGNEKYSKYKINAESKGQGFGLQYSIGMGLGRNLAWRKKYYLGYGLLLDSRYVFGNKACVYSAGAGFELKILWLLSFAGGLGYAYFPDRMKYIDHLDNSGGNITPAYKTISNSGLYYFAQTGICFPLTSRLDLFTFYEYCTYKKQEQDPEYGSWQRESMRFGAGYKF